MGDGESVLLGGTPGGRSREVPHVAEREQGDAVAFAQAASAPYRQVLEGCVAPCGSGAFAARVADGEGGAGVHGGVHHVAQLVFVHGNGDGHVGYAPQVGEVELPLVGLSVFADQPRPVEAEHHAQALDGHVVDDVVVGPLHERRIDVAERYHSLGGQSGGEGDGVPLGDAHVETAVGHALHHGVERAAGGHGGGDAHHGRIHLGQLHDRLSEDVLPAVGGRGGRRAEAFAGVGVETSRSVPQGLVVFGFGISLPLDGQYVQQFGPGNLLQVVEHGDQGLYVVAVHRSEVAELEAFEYVAAVEQAVLDGIAEFADNPQQPRRARGEVGPQPGLEVVVAARGGHAQQLLLESSHVGVDGHAVVVENHQQVSLSADTGVVEPLEGQSAGHGAVADDRHHAVFLALQLERLGDAQRGGDGDGGVAAAECVVGAFVARGKSADASHLAVGVEPGAAAGDDFVGVGLVADVPHQFVFGGVVYVVQGRGELHGAEIGGQVPRIFGELLDDEVAQLAAEFGKGFDRQLFQVVGRVDVIEVFVFRRRHGLNACVAPEGDGRDTGAGAGRNPFSGGFPIGLQI